MLNLFIQDDWVRVAKTWLSHNAFKCENRMKNRGKGYARGGCQTSDMAGLIKEYLIQLLALKYGRVNAWLTDEETKLWKHWQEKKGLHTSAHSSPASSWCPSCECSSCSCSPCSWAQQITSGKSSIILSAGRLARKSEYTANMRVILFTGLKIVKSIIYRFSQVINGNNLLKMRCNQSMNIPTKSEPG